MKLVEVFVGITPPPVKLNFQAFIISQLVFFLRIKGVHSVTVVRYFVSSMYVLTASDDKSYVVERDVLIRSQLLHNMVEGLFIENLLSLSCSF